MERKINVVVGKRGTITLPLEVRRLLGIEEGDVMPMKIEGGDIIFSRGAVLPIEIYSEEDIQEWVREDELSASERKKAEKKMAIKTKRG